jgi:outer membrane lipoprotein SlyB
MTSRLIWVCGLAALSLAGCSATATPAAQAVAAPDNGRTLTGTVAAVRTASVPGGAASALQDVLTALRQNQAPASASGQEIVIRLNDGNPVDIGRTAPVSGLTPGGNVVIVEAGETTLIRRN